jgi:hypothetical protein
LEATGLEIDIGKVYMSEHAKKRAYQIFNINPNQALPYFRSVLKKANYIGISKGGHLFTFNRIAIVLSPNYRSIVTVMLNYRRKQTLRKM